MAQAELKYTMTDSFVRSMILAMRADKYKAQVVTMGEPSPPIFKSVFEDFIFYSGPFAIHLEAEVGALKNDKK